jgi:arylsulfatase A-like enzyme
MNICPPLLMANLVAGAALAQGAKPPEPAPARPNIILILMDDLGYGDLSCYNPNSGISTPNIDKLAAEGIRSDNGGTPTSINAPLRGYKQGMLEGGIRVPAIAKWPGVYPAGVVSHQVGILMDFSRTILEADGAAEFADPKRPFDGFDLTPPLAGRTPEVKRELGWRRREWDLGKRGFNNVWAEAYIKGDRKNIREFKETPGFARSVKGDYPETGYLELVYDLANDIHEDQNRAQENPGKLRELRTAFEKWKERTVAPDNHYRIPFPDQYAREQERNTEGR